MAIYYTHDFELDHSNFCTFSVIYSIDLSLLVILLCKIYLTSILEKSSKLSQVDFVLMKNLNYNKDIHTVEPLL